MKWCFILNNAQYLMELLGKLSYQIIREGDECVAIANCKITEYDMRKYFPKDIKFLSKVDWCLKNYKKGQKIFDDFSWKEFFPSFDRKSRLKLLRFDFDKSVEMVSQIYQFVDYIFKSEKPDLFINEPPVDLFKEIIYHFCKKNKATYFGLMIMGLEKRVAVYDLEYTCSLYEKTFKQKLNLTEEEKKLVQDLIKNFPSFPQPPSYMVESVSHFERVNLTEYYLKRIKKVYESRLKYLLNRKKFKPFDYESESILKSMVQAPLNAVERKIRILLQSNIFEHLNNNDNFFLFPLHWQPECSTSLQATYYCDQLSTIRNIAFTLPFPYKLYVKEHPAAVGTRPGNFYKELKKIPNIVLISPYEDGKNLIKKSQGVIVLTSDMGTEAAFLGKLVYVLGEVFYSYHPFCRKVKNFEELRQKIKDDLNNRPNIGNLEDLNLRFLVSCFSNTFSGELLFDSEKNDPNDYKEIYNSLKKIFYDLRK